MADRHPRVAFLPCEAQIKAQRHPATYPHVLNRLGDHIRRKRLDLGLFLKEAASRLGAHATTVANWEEGRTAPAVQQLPKVIRFLGYDPRPEPSALAERLKHHRAGLGMSQNAMAKQLGIDPGTLRLWEGGHRRPEGKYLAKVYSFFGQDPRPAAATIGERLKRYREGLGWSQRAMARKIGVHPATLVRWEKGQREPQGDYVARVEAMLNGSGVEPTRV